MNKPFSISHSVVILLTIIILVSLSIAVAHPQGPPPPDDVRLEVGSTDGITTLAFLITGIIILPLLSSRPSRKDKEEKKK